MYKLTILKHFFEQERCDVMMFCDSVSWFSISFYSKVCVFRIDFHGQ